MKPPQISKKKQGMTLIELTVAILVMLGLITVTFVGAKAWKRGSDRAMSILLIRSAQMGMRSFSQMQGIGKPTAYPDLPEELFGHNKFVSNGINRSTGQAKAVGELPDHPNPQLSFDFVSDNGESIPPLGTLYICTGGSSQLNDYTYNPVPSHYKQW